MSDAEDRGSGRLVTATRLDANETVFDDVDAANTMLSSKRIEGEEDCYRVRVLLALSGDSDANGKTLLKFDGDSFRYVGRFFGCGCELPHISGRYSVRVLKNTSFI